MDTKDEMIEEIEDLSLEKEKDENVTNEINKVNDSSSKPDLSGVVVEPIIDENVVNNNVKLENNESEKPNETLISNLDNETKVSNEDNKIVKEKKNKVPLIILLVVLLILDIIALVIYIIGIEKVISFIK